MSLPKFYPLIQKWLKEKGLNIGWTSALAIALAFVIQWRTEDRIDHQDIIRDLRIEVKELREEVAELRKINSHMSSRLSVLSAGQYELPIPMWLKDRMGRYVSINKAFESQLLIPNGIDPESVIGKMDIEIWPDSNLARSYRALDIEVIRTRSVISRREAAIIDGNKVLYQAWKYPYFLGQQLIGVGGVAMPAND